MKYFQNPNGKVYAYDETDPTQTSLIAAAVTAGWTDITASWPPAPIPVALSVLAQSALTKTDTTMLRVQEAITLGLTTATTADVVAFVQYRKALRAIVDGTDTTSTSLPAQPAYPQGT